MCLAFVEQGEPVGPSCSLAAMLRTSLAWMPAPDLSSAAPEDRYCLVTEGFYGDFLLRPERAPFYRADIASRCQVPPNLLALSPANPPPTDVCLYGRRCRTVVAVGSSHVRDADNNLTVGLLDCRPIFEGWRRLLTDRGYVDLQMLRDVLEQSAPPACQVHFSSCRQHWTWLWIEPGQTVQVSYIPRPAPGQGPTDEGSAGGPADPHRDPPLTEGSEMQISLPRQAGEEGFAQPLPSNADQHISRGLIAGAASTNALGLRKPDAALWRSPRFKLVVLLGTRGHAARVQMYCNEALAQQHFGGPLAVSMNVLCAPRPMPKWFCGHKLDVPSIRDSRGFTSEPRPGISGHPRGSASPAARSCKLLHEPADGGTGRHGPVARVRAGARAFGDPWPYAGLDVPDVAVQNPQVTDQVLPAPAVTLAVCILTPAHDKEYLTVQLPAPPHVGETLAAVRQARHDLRGRVFPFIFFPPAQPRRESLLAGAYPSWAIADTFGVFDLTQYDRRLFLEGLPSVVSRDIILNIARIPATDDVSVFLNEASVPLRADAEVPVHTGVLIIVCRVGSGRAQSHTVQQVLAHAMLHGSHQIFHPPPAGRHLCIVTETGQSLLSFRSEEVLPSPMVLPSLMGFPLSFRVCPARQSHHDVELWGFPCSAVLAIVDRAQSESEPYACIVDARGLLQGWSVFMFGEEGLALNFVHDILETFMPPHRRLHLEGADIEAGHLCCHDGHIIRATFAPEVPPSIETGFGSEGGDSESHTDDLMLDPPGDSEDSESDPDHDSRRADSDRSRSPRRSSGGNVDAEGEIAPGVRRLSIRRSTPLQRAVGCMHLPICIFASRAVVSVAVHAGSDGPHLRAPANLHTHRQERKHHEDAPRELRPTMRPLPTPCRGRNAEPQVATEQALSTASSGIECAVQTLGAASMQGARRPSPKRCAQHASGQHQEAALSLADIGKGLDTLLDRSCVDHRARALFLAATLLETLVEHFGETPLRLSLCRTIPKSIPHPATAQSTESFSPWRDLSHMPVPTPWCPSDLPELGRCSPGDNIRFGALSAGVSPAQVLQLLQPGTHLVSLGATLCALSQTDVAFLSNQRCHDSDFENSNLHCFADGSFFKASGGCGAVMAWACFYICPRTGASGVVSGLVPAELAAASGAASAFVAECFALAAAAWIGATMFHHQPLCIRTDCQAALGIFLGESLSRQAGVAAFLKGIGNLCRAICQSPPQASYIPGHQGCLGNEVADRVAKLAAKGVSLGSGPWHDNAARAWTEKDCAPLCWCGIVLKALQGQSTLPPQDEDVDAACADTLGLGQYQVVAPFLPVPSVEGEASASSPWGGLHPRGADGSRHSAHQWVCSLCLGCGRRYLGD